MIANKKEFFGGLALMGGFILVLIIMFLPLFNGKNSLDYMDSLYNSISKGSAYYIPKLKEEAKAFEGKDINMTISMESEQQAKDTGFLFSKAGAKVEVVGKQITVHGDCGKIFLSCLEDADNMFHNNGDVIVQKYGIKERQVMYNWWTAFKVATTELNLQKRFDVTKYMGVLSKKGVECSYNYYKIDPQKIMDKIGIVIFSLVFYVIYTLWYGFAIMFMFEGWGMNLEH